MNKTLLLIVLTIAVSVSACTSQENATTPPQPAVETAAPVETQVPTEIPPTETASDSLLDQIDPTPTVVFYSNAAFGLGFTYPSSWFGPDEYVSDLTLRVSVGSDVVYPYGTDREEQIYTLPNSYYVLIQYTQNDQSQVWNDTLQALANLQDGESLSDARSLTIRVRQLELGRFTGYEYIATLSETAQTEPFYARQVILMDPQTNDLLTIMGSPNNVDLSGGDWRQAYQAIDEANQTIFEQIVASITIQ